MVRRAVTYIVFAALLTLIDDSGQDAILFGRRGDFEFGRGRISEGLKWYQTAYRFATLATPNAALQGRFLNNIGACQLILFRYNDSAQTLLRARHLAQNVKDYGLMGSTDANLASVYVQMDNLPAAEMSALSSLQAYSRTSKPKEVARAQTTLADILSREHFFKKGEQLFLEAIRTATRLEDRRLASSIWLHYGTTLSNNGQLDDADRAFSECVRLQSDKMSDDALLWHLSRLRLLQHNLPRALDYINFAIEVSGHGGLIPKWRLYETRAEVELANGHLVSSLRDAGTALQWAKTLRAEIIPDNDNRVGWEGLLDDVFSVLIDAGNLVYLQTHSRALLRETFEAAERNRAESLELLLPMVSDWRHRLPAPQYWDKLAEFQIEQRREVSSKSTQSSERFRQLEIELSEMESSAKARFRASRHYIGQSREISSRGRFAFECASRLACILVMGGESWRVTTLSPSFQVSITQ